MFKCHRQFSGRGVQALSSVTLAPRAALSPTRRGHSLLAWPWGQALSWCGLCSSVCAGIGAAVI
eukprot:358550-Pyramimonas_sp.AAC.1